jgi:hypothetical protein
MGGNNFLGNLILAKEIALSLSEIELTVAIGATMLCQIVYEGSECAAIYPVSHLA